MSESYLDAGALISQCGKYRYLLWREWRGHGSDQTWFNWEDDEGIITDGEGGPIADPLSCVFVMLNPSTADGRQDDPTIRKCVSFAKRWGFDRLDVVNLFAFRATSPRDMLAVRYPDDPVGWENKRHVAKALEKAGRIVCAWGAHGSHMDQAETMLGWIDEHNIRDAPVVALRISHKTGQPGHPLYIPGDTEPLSHWPERRAA